MLLLQLKQSDLAETRNICEAICGDYDISNLVFLGNRILPPSRTNYFLTSSAKICNKNNPVVLYYITNTVTQYVEDRGTPPAVTVRFASVSVRQRPVPQRVKSFRQRLISVRQRPKYFLK